MSPPRFAVLATVMGAIGSATAWTSPFAQKGPVQAARRLPRSVESSRSFLLSDSFMENDLVAVRTPPAPTEEGGDGEGSEGETGSSSRLCVVRPDSGVHPLCYHEDDVETDLFVDPRAAGRPWTEGVTDDDVVGTYGEGWYGQRPVPSLGGGPGYGAEADEVWSVDEELLGRLRDEGVDLPVLDVGTAHGEKARGGAF